MHVAALWRYPVKSLAGEPLQTAELTLDGVTGDRTVHVRGSRGPLTGRTRHDLLTVSASTAPDGVPQVAGHAWDSAAARELVQAAGGPDAELAEYDGPERFDIANLLVATDGALARFGADVRRLRPNLLLDGVPDHTSRPGPAVPWRSATPWSGCTRCASGASSPASIPTPASRTSTSSGGSAETSAASSP
jgi:hypothetical protein